MSPVLTRVSSGQGFSSVATYKRSFIARSRGGATPGRSVRFNLNDSAYFSRTPGSAGNRRIWTWSGWVKLGKIPQADRYTLFECTVGFDGSDSSYALLNFNSTSQLGFGVANGGSYTTAVFRDPSAWYHVVAAVDTTQATASDRLKLYVNGVQYTHSGYTYTQNLETAINTTFSHSIGMEDNSNLFKLDGYLALVHFIDGQALTPSSFGETSATTGQWIAKTYSGTYGTNGFFLNFSDNSNNTVSTLGKDSSGNNNNWTPINISTSTTSVTYARNTQPASSTPYASTTLTDTTWESTVSNDGGFMSNTIIPRTTTKTYIEIRHTSSGGGNPGPGVSNSTSLEIGLASVFAWYRGAEGLERGTVGTFTGSNVTWTTTDYLGIGMDPTANGGAGSITFYKNGVAVWTGGSGWTSYNMRFQWQNNGNGTDSGIVNYGASPFQYLPNDHVGLIASSSPNTTDSLRDHPTSTGTSTGAGGEVAGNYCTWNPLNKGSNVTLSNGNLETSHGGVGAHSRVVGTFGMSSGKWYYEATLTTVGGTYPSVGVAFAESTDMATYVGAETGTFGYNTVGSVNGGGGGRTYSSFTTGDVIGVAIDLDNNRITFYKNGANAVTSGTTYENLTSGKVYVPSVSGYGNSAAWSCNFGQRAFAYSAPAGFSPLVDTLLPAPTIALPNQYVGIVTYTGNGASDAAIRGFGFQPDLVWLKNRAATNNHALFDSIRAADQQFKPYLSSNSTAAEASTDGALEYWYNDGFQMANGATVSAFNTNNQGYVCWAWDAGSDVNPTTNTSGSISSNVRVNNSSKFSIVSYTGNGGFRQTVGHSLGVAPSLILIKSRDTAQNWVVWHKNTSTTPWQDYLVLNSTVAKQDAYTPDLFGGMEHTDTVFYVSTNNLVNKSNDKFIAYCWADVPGYSSFGSFTGNGSATDGPFVYTGFRPRWILVRNISVTQSWALNDTDRAKYNLVNAYLAPNLTGSEQTTYAKMDILSNGFKIRETDSFINGNSNTHIYAAFAEFPFQYSRAR